MPNGQTGPKLEIQTLHTYPVGTLLYRKLSNDGICIRCKINKEDLIRMVSMYAPDGQGVLSLAACPIPHIEPPNRRLAILCT